MQNEQGFMKKTIISIIAVLPVMTRKISANHVRNWPLWASKGAKINEERRGDLVLS